MKPIIPALLLTLTGAGALTAYQVTTVPALGPTPKLILPKVEQGQLSNGLKVTVSRNAEVPLVEVRLMVNGGARVGGAPAGLATFAAQMVNEGAGGRDAFQLAEAIDFLGANLNASANWEYISINLNVPKRNVDSAMALMQDMVVRPTFASGDVTRQRDLRQAALIAARDNPNAVASRVFMRNLYPAGHPYHENLNGDSATTAALDSAVVRDFWQRAMDPAGATLTVTGDVSLKEATAWAERWLGEWKSPAAPLTSPAASSVVTPEAESIRVILVDKPEAAQSVIMVGKPGAARASTDYPTLEVLTTILGGSFSSRINHILREERGYTYGASSRFLYLPVTGPFQITTAVRTDVTDSSLAIIFREVRRIIDSPVPEDELVRARNFLTLGSLGDFETAGDIAGALQTAQLFGIPFASISDELEAMKTISSEQVRDAAGRYLAPDRMLVVVVGDLKRIRSGIERLKLGPVTTQLY